LVTSYDSTIYRKAHGMEIKKIHLKQSSDIACRLHFPSASSLARSLVRLKANVLCHGKRVRVTGSFLRRSLKVASDKFKYDSSRDDKYSDS
jgi:hypothetical protein